MPSMHCRTIISADKPPLLPERNAAKETVMDDIEEIKKLKARYFRALDSKDWDTYAGVFAEGCSVDLRRAGGELYNGRADFAAYARSLTLVQSVHHGHMPEIDLDSPTSASGVWVPGSGPINRTFEV